MASSSTVGRAVGLVAAAAALPAAVVASPFWLVSALTRRLPATLGLGPAAMEWRELLRYAPEVGWQLRPNLDGHGAVEEGVFHLTTDAEGWRGSAPLDAAELVVVGDSYALGHGVDDADTYLEHLGGIAAKSLGSDGYSMVHTVLWLERLRERLAGKTVVWMIYPGNDLYDNLRPSYGRYRMPFVRQRDGGWEIHTDHVSSDPWPLPEEHASYPDELARVCTPGHESDRAYAAATYLLDRGARTCEQIGARLIVVSVPRRDQIDPLRVDGLRGRSPDPERFDPARPDGELRRASEERSLEFIALADHLTADDYFERDIHWTPAGHVKVGRLLAERYRSTAERSA